jgi:multiple sugar transport system substrate-binding protein
MIGSRITMSLLALAVALAALTAGAAGTPEAARGAPTAVTLTITANGVVGGKNNAEASWITNYVIPNFERTHPDVDVRYAGSGAADEAYKAQIALDMRTGGGADIIAIDGIWVGEFAEARFIKPLREVVGPTYERWSGWKQIPKAVQANASFRGVRYGIPAGTDGRIIYFNKTLFSRAGLPQRWQPRSWNEILAVARTLKSKLPDVTPLQVNAGTAMGEATTAQGFLPLLVGAGKRIFDPGTRKWLGNTRELRDVLNFYRQVYRTGLGDADLQLRAGGRDRSFQQFSEHKIAILVEGDFFWRSIISPTGLFPIKPDRESVVGWALIPAKKPFAGFKGPSFKRGQSFVSISGGGGRVLNPNTKNPSEAWALLTFMNSRDAVAEFVKTQPRITQRADVNKVTLFKDPLLAFVARNVLPLTVYRPGLAIYPQVSQLLQLASQEVVSGTSVDDAAKRYHESLVKLVGATNVVSS